MRPWKLPLAAAVLLAAAATVPTAGPATADPAGPGPLVVHAAPGGSGAGCAATSPCSLERARDLARAAAARGNRDVVVRLAGGTYRLDAPLVLDSRDSGRNGHTVTWTSASRSGPPAVLSGGARITGWKLADPARNLWTADWKRQLPAGSPLPRQLYVDGKRATRARGAACPKATCPATAAGIGGAQASGVADFARPQDVDAVYRVRWRNFHCRVTGVDGDTLTMAQPCWTNSGSGTGRTGPAWDSTAVDSSRAAGVAYFENAPELLDQPGEFAAGSDGVLHYLARPGEDPSRADVEIPSTEQLLRIDGARGLRIQGLGFRYAAWHQPGTDDGYAGMQAGTTLTGATGPADLAGRYYTKPGAAVVVRGSQDVRIDGCRLEHLGGAGVRLEAGTGHSAVTGSTFDDLASGGVYVGDMEPNPAADQQSDDNTVARNTLTRIGADYTDAVGIWAGYVTGLTVDHNTLQDLPYSGISVGWGWNQPVARHPHLGGNAITGNRIANAMAADIGQHDGGAIYTQGPQPGTVISGNYINRVSYPPAEKDGNGIYLDEQSSHILVEGNVITRIGYKWVSNWADYGIDNTARGNWSDAVAPPLGGTGSVLEDNQEGLAALPAEAIAAARAAGAHPPGAVEQLG